jgi:hypothetical protein
MRTALRQPVSRLTPKRWLTKRWLTQSRLHPPANLERCYFSLGRLAHGERILVSYLLPTRADLRRFESRQDARLPQLLQK